MKIIILGVLIACVLAYPTPDTPETDQQNALPEGEKSDGVEERFGGHGGHRRPHYSGGHYPGGAYPGAGHQGGHYPGGAYQGGQYGGAGYPGGQYGGSHYPGGGFGR